MLRLMLKYILNEDRKRNMVSTREILEVVDVVAVVVVTENRRSSCWATDFEETLDTCCRRCISFCAFRSQR